MQNPWKAPDQSYLPDFIIIGGMKCGTTTLHHILNSHPKIYIPQSEIHFFDMDDEEEHPEFIFKNGNNIIRPNVEENPQAYWDWYKSYFEKANDNVKGEVTTGYFTSEKALKRISEQDKKIKLILSLRNPLSRTNSHYWHQVKAGRAKYSLIKTFKSNPDFLLKRSNYKKYIELLFKYFPKEQVHIVIFEEFLKEKERILKEILNFLELSFEDLPKEAIELHSNKAVMPRSVQLQLLKNRLAPVAGQWLYRKHFHPIKDKTPKKQLFDRLIHNTNTLINPLKESKTPKLDQESEAFLKNHFQKEFQGINDLIGKDLIGLWNI